MLFVVIGIFTWTTTAQFGFFDQMFGGGGGGGQQHQQQQQNVRSDASWYQAQYENGASCFALCRPNRLPSPQPWPAMMHAIC